MLQYFVPTLVLVDITVLRAVVKTITRNVIKIKIKKIFFHCLPDCNWKHSI